MSSPTSPKKPEIRYPTAWGYRLIGEDEAAMRQAISEVLGELDHVLSRGQESAQGRYRSLSLELVVESQAQRDAIFRGLSEHPAVRWLI